MEGQDRWAMVAVLADIAWWRRILIPFRVLREGGKVALLRGTSRGHLPWLSGVLGDGSISQGRKKPLKNI